MATKPLTVSGVVRDLLTAAPELPTVDVLHRAKARGLKATDKAIREAVHNVRSQVRKAARTAAAKPVGPAVAPAAVPPTMSGAIRVVLAGDLDLPADRVIERVHALGVTAPAEKLQNLTKNLRSEMKKAARPAAPAPATAPAPAAAPAPAVAPDLAAVLGTVTRVHAAVTAAGGPAAARDVAEAVRASGGVDAFLRHVDLVAGISGAGG